jgi:hypothetical protein
MLPSSVIHNFAVCMWTDVSEERITFIFRFENHPSKKPDAGRTSETHVHLQTTRPYIAEDGNIHNYRCENLLLLQSNQHFITIREIHQIHALVPHKAHSSL